MATMFLNAGVVSIFVIALLVDISINLRRINGNLKKMAQSYDKIHGSDKV